MIKGVVDQTQRRVSGKENMPASEKVFSLFESHTDIIIKGSRDTQYGHNLDLSSGKSGLILDIVIEEGNPADADRIVPMLERHEQTYGKAPCQVASDGGYASTAYLEAAEELGVKDMAYNKKRGLAIEDMFRCNWDYQAA